MLRQLRRKILASAFVCVLATVGVAAVTATAAAAYSAGFYLTNYDGNWYTVATISDPYSCSTGGQENCGYDVYAWDHCPNGTVEHWGNEAGAFAYTDTSETSVGCKNIPTRYGDDVVGPATITRPA
jgi:lipocalin